MSSGYRMETIVSFVERYGFKLMRQRKHLIFIHHTGARLVTSKSASDFRALNKIKSDIHKLLQINDKSNYTD